MPVQRLPIVGSDDGSWGQLLNNFLLVSHAPNGALRTWVNTAARPANPDLGTTGVNVQTQELEQWDGTNWTQLTRAATPSNVGNATAQWNANQIQGRNVATTAPTDGQVVAWNNTTNEYQPKTITGICFNVLDYIPANLHAAIRNRTINQDLSTYINAAVTAITISAQYTTLTFPSGLYTIDKPVIVRRRISLDLDATAEIKAITGFSGASVPAYSPSPTAFTSNAMLKTEPEDVTDYWDFSEIKGGIINGNNIADIGIELIRVRFCRVSDMTIRGCRLHGILSGVSTVSTSYELELNLVRVYREDVANSTNSLGIWLKNTTDSYFTQLYVIGYRVGIKDSDGSASNDFQFCHVWGKTVNGPLTRCFDIGGANNTYNQCYADTPGDGAADVYGFYIDAQGVRVTNSRVYIAPTFGVGVDNTTVCFFGGPNSNNCAACSFSNNFFTATLAKRIKIDFQNFTGAFLMGNRIGTGVTTSTGDQYPRQVLYRTATGVGNVETRAYNPSGGAADFGVDVYPQNNYSSTSEATYSLFQRTGTTGAVGLKIYRGDAPSFAAGSTAINTLISGNGVSYINSVIGNVGVGTTTPGTKMQVNGGLSVSSSATGTVNPGAGNLLVQGNIKLGSAPNTIQYAAAAPISGNWTQGDITYNTAPIAGGFVGWVCTSTGAPGTWKTFGAISL
jgi:hypothetical protein